MIQKITFAWFMLFFQSDFALAQDVVIHPNAKLLTISETGNAKFDNAPVFRIPNFKENIVFIFTRHAEKKAENAQNNNDPELTPAGVLRAKNLTKILQDQPLAGVFSTQTNRTIATAKPTAASKGTSVQIYGNDHKTMLYNLLEQGGMKRYLIVGHSNTVPMMLNYLTDSNQYSELPGFDNIYVAVLSRVGVAKVYHFKY